MAHGYDTGAGPGREGRRTNDGPPAELVRDKVLEHFRQGMELWELLIPYSESRTEAMLHAHAVVESSKHLEKGTFYRIRIEAGWAKKLGLDRFRTGAPS